ncbi:uncharacterized protein LOC122282453 [Carya illinoinensis]|uniref:uncharacterized protein LOC122282453 n=1 Tax=Carya illinoinensis TaxID=32201 RepID=UPI001C71E697|nr:uncharacterized protein LOC122282453 [Carya illinoinensis]
MDKSWMHIGDRLRSHEYAEGVNHFLSMAQSNAPASDAIRCPCRICRNNFFQPFDVVRDHLFLRGIDISYTQWIFHGEDDPFHANRSDDEDDGDDFGEYVDDVDEMLDDIRVGSFVNSAHGLNAGGGDDDAPEPNVGTSRHHTFEQYVEDARRPLYPSCANYSKLSFMVKLLHIKSIGGWNVKSFNMVLKLLKSAFPTALLPEDYNDARQLKRGLGFSYTKIHVCPNDCILFWKEYEDKDQCPKCKSSRWVSLTSKHRVPQKVMRYFPLMPRLQRLYMSKKTAQAMRWHKEQRIDDSSCMRHPADSKVWKDFDRKHDWFAKDARNVRLGLASDGFNPFNNMSKPYSIWPVILLPYNLPPWSCMKDPYFLLTCLIPGPKSPGNDIDIFLRPLVDELKSLWEVGIETYDAFSSDVFQLHASLLWTINDFPAYANLSGWSTKGKLACPVCNVDTDSMWLAYGRKHCYMGHRRWLAPDHRWRKNKRAFNGALEVRPHPPRLTAQEILESLRMVSNVQFGKSERKRKRAPHEQNWTKKSIFFDLPYWQDVGLRHNLDVMHIEKNICDSVLGTLLSIDGKSKDTANARRDLERLGLRKELHLRPEGDRCRMSLACYTLNHNERISFCEWVSQVSFPDGFASNIARCVNIREGKITGMKSHDCHIFLQRLLPVVIGSYLRPDIRLALTELSTFFKELCARTLTYESLHRLQADISIILCKLEMIFPPAFFDIMVHLAIHLPDEALLAGPVQYRWMYPFERYLGKFKRYVRNKARPEGSIAEAYVHVECLTFCSMYLNDIETRYKRVERNADIPDQLNDEFFSVFSQKIREKRAMNPASVRDEIYALACGPDKWVASYAGCIMNGIRFQTKDRERHRRTQNSGLVVRGEHQSNPVDFYGVLKDIIELRYMGWRKVYLFQCDWWDVGDKRKGIRVGDHLTSLNTSRTWYKDEPFALACQAQQVFYLKDMSVVGSWYVVHKITNRNVYNIPLVSSVQDADDPAELVHDDAFEEDENIPTNVPHAQSSDPDLMTPLNRLDEEPILIDPSTILEHQPSDLVDHNAFLEDDGVDDDQGIDEADANSDRSDDDSIAFANDASSDSEDDYLAGNDK